ncbi:MAG: HAMP domain-containing sensor histidine kinase [Catalinimonas sp.]
MLLGFAQHAAFGFGVSVAHTLGLWQSMSGRPTIAKWVLFVVSTITIIYSSLVFGQAGGAQLFFMPLLIAAVLLLGWKERRSLAGVVLVILTGIVVLEFNLSAPMRMTLDVEEQTEIYRSSWWGALFVTALAGTFLLRLNHQTDQTIRRTEDSLRASNATKDRLFSIIAHDLRGDLGNVRGLIDLMALGMITPEEREDVMQKLQGTAARSHELLDNLLTWARSQHEAYEPAYLPVSLHQVAEKQVRRYADIAENKSIAVVNHVPDPTVVRSDELMLEVIIRNLFTNALKFTPRGGKVSFSTEANEERTILWVEDNGTGMPPELLEKLFEIRHRQHTRGTGGEPGTGLGLMLCREVVQQHGGDLLVSSIKGVGSRFGIVLPSPIVDAPQEALRSLRVSA